MRTRNYLQQALAVLLLPFRIPDYDANIIHNQTIIHISYDWMHDAIQLHKLYYIWRIC